MQQIAVAGLVLGQQQHVVAGFVELGVFVAHAAAGQVGFDADDGFDACFFGGTVKFEGAIHRAVVGEGDGRLPQFRRSPHQIIHPAQPVEQGVFAVAVQVDKLLVI